MSHNFRVLIIELFSLILLQVTKPMPQVIFYKFKSFNFLG